MLSEEESHFYVSDPLTVLLAVLSGQLVHGLEICTADIHCCRKSDQL